MCSQPGMVNAENEEQGWRELCERASRETDPKKLIALVDQINRALEQLEQRLRQASDRKPDEEAPADS